MASRALISIVLVGACSSESRWEWPESAPEEQQMDSAMLEGARTYAFQSGKNTQGVVVTRRGVLVAEWYEDGRGPESYAASWSMGKSVTSALIGIAIGEGKISGVDVPLTDTYPQWAGTSHADIRLENVLHMASGLKWNENYSPAMANESDVVQIVFTLESPLDYVLARPVESPPNTAFVYSSGDTLLLSGVLAKATGKRAGDYAQEKLFSRLGIADAHWWRAKTGETLTYCCLDMPTRDFARIGLLYMQRGMFDGEQVVPTSWVDASLTSSPRYAGYGYQWWLEGKSNPSLPPDLFMANGHDGQYIYVIPSRDLVIVRNGHYDKYEGKPIADPALFSRYPSDNLTPGSGTVPPDSWSHAQFLAPILASIQD